MRENCKAIQKYKFKKYVHKTREMARGTDQQNQRGKNEKLQIYKLKRETQSTNLFSFPEQQTINPNYATSGASLSNWLQVEGRGRCLLEVWSGKAFGHSRQIHIFTN